MTNRDFAMTCFALACLPCADNGAGDSCDEPP
nr:MAG TPA: hypothetical protein [Caudoviricetes sp.]